MRKSEIFALGVILLSFLVGIYFYPKMPEKMAIHWNLKGEVNRYIPKFFGLFLIPFISLGLFLLFIVIPKIEPNIEKFAKYYDRFMILSLGFLLYVYLITIFWNMGIRLNIIQVLTPAFGVLYFYCGILIENAKRNWFIGIRTPWTLSNERVWEKTHKIGGKLFKIAGVISFAGMFFEKYALFFIVIPVILIVTYTIVYSYFEYQKEVKVK